MRGVVAIAIHVTFSPQFWYASLGNRVKLHFGAIENDWLTHFDARNTKGVQFKDHQKSNISSWKQPSTELGTYEETDRRRRHPNRSQPVRPHRTEANSESSEASVASTDEYGKDDNDEATFGMPEYETKSNFKAIVLGEEAEIGSKLHIREAQPLKKHLGRVLSRLFMGRHDYVVEGVSSEPTYILKGKTWSMHQRFHLYIPGESVPRFTIRRAWGNYNPAGTAFGQYVYRLLPYSAEPSTGLKNVFNYNTTRSLFTITKDRFGRGALWQRQEWRIYKGTGGCWFWGVLSCDKNKQIYYGLSKGLKDFLSYDMEIFEGQGLSAIQAMAGNAQSAKLYSGEKLDRARLNEIKVAESKHGSGERRPLSWVARWLNAAGTAAGTGIMPEVGNLLLPVISINALSNLARMLWVDRYELQFVKPTDKLLMALLVMLQDVSNDFDKRMVMQQIQGPQPL